MKELQQNTFGNSNCAVNLVSILNSEFPEQSTKVCRCIAKRFRDIKIIAQIQSCDLRRDMLKLYYQHKILPQVKIMHLAPKVESHLLSLLTAKIKQFCND